MRQWYPAKPWVNENLGWSHEKQKAPRDFLPWGKTPPPSNAKEEPTMFSHPSGWKEKNSSTLKMSIGQPLVREVPYWPRALWERVAGSFLRYGSTLLERCYPGPRHCEVGLLVPFLAVLYSQMYARYLIAVGWADERWREREKREWAIKETEIFSTNESVWRGLLWADIDIQ